MKIEKGKGIVLSEIFVDDIIFGGQDALCKDFVNQMKQEFEMSMFGEVKFLLGSQVYQKKYGIYITHSNYVKEILNFFGLEDSKPVSTPLVIGHKLSKNDDSVEVNKTLYRSMITKLQYVLHNRPNIVLSVGIVVRFFVNPRENHLMAMKRIMRYLKGTEEFGLYYKVGNIDEKKSTSGGAFFLGKRLVTWTSKKQNCTSQSTIESEYVNDI